ncbi:MAG TPA: hypothetical protein PLN91_16195, partial [Rhodanobacteraceae bacterium]|nr:hypothetical protein [Rhodanobacteraceae bacterium]
MTTSLIEYMQRAMAHCEALSDADVALRVGIEEIERLTAEIARLTEERDAYRASSEIRGANGEAMRALLAAERERWMAALRLQHDYRGACPDDSQPTARDPNCPACRALIDFGAEHLADDLENDMLEQDRKEPMVMPGGPWSVYWQGSGPERGNHIMCGRERVAYLPAPDGTEGLHKEAERIVYEALEQAREKTGTDPVVTLK